MKSQFVYISTCCNAEASKPPCVAVPKVARKKKGKKGEDKSPEYASLGHWSCGQCGKGCKVTRQNRPEESKKETAHA